MSPNMPSNLFRALRGPVLMMTLGAVLAFDHFTNYDFGDTWPLLLIAFGVMTMLEHLFGRADSPYSGGPGTGV